MEAILSWILETLSQFNIYIYTLVAPFLEELIAPIPSPVVFGTLGSIAYVQKLEIGMLFVLNLIGSLSKTIAGIIIYYVDLKSKGGDNAMKHSRNSFLLDAKVQ